MAVKKDAKTAGSEFLAGVLATLAPEQREKAQELIDVLAPAIGEGVLRQEDYSRLVQEAQEATTRANTLYESNTDWFAANKTELDTLREKAGKQPPVTEVTKVPENVVTNDTLKSTLDEMERGAVGFIAEANVLSMQHYKEFGEILDIRPLLADKRIQSIGLQGVYKDTFKDQLAAKATAAQTARDEALRNEGRVAERQALASSTHPYPVRGNEPSALDAIEAARAGQTPVIKDTAALAMEYDRLGAARNG